MLIDHGLADFREISESGVRCRCFWSSTNLVSLETP